MTKSIKNNVSHFEEYSRIEKAIAEMENVTSNTKYTFNLCCEKVHNNFEGASNTISFPKANFSSLCLNNTIPIETNDSDEIDAEKEARIVMYNLFPENEQQHCVFFDNEGMGVAVLKIRDAKDCETIRFMVVTYCYYSGSFSSVRFLKSEKAALIRYVVNILNISSDKISVKKELNALFGEETKSFILKEGKLIIPQSGEIYSDLTDVFEYQAGDMIKAACENKIQIHEKNKMVDGKNVSYYAINKADFEEVETNLRKILPLLAAAGYIYYRISASKNKTRYSLRIQSKDPSSGKTIRPEYILIKKDMLPSCFEEYIEKEDA